MEDDFHVISHDTDSGTIVLNKQLETNSSTGIAQVYFNKDDLLDVVVNDIGIVLNKNIIINGGLYLDSCILKLTGGSKIHVNDTGRLKVNKIVKDSSGNVMRTALTKIITTGDYGGDNYRTTNTSVINGNGTMVLNTVWWYQETTRRSDWDLTSNSNIWLYNSVLIGPSSSYHHILSGNLTIDDFTIMNSYSVELMQTPIYMNKFRSINCHYGLSFYPPSSTPFVTMSNTVIEHSTVTIKRNSRSNLKLVNPSIDFDNITFSGSIPIKICYTTYDRVLTTDGMPASNVAVNYLFEAVPASVLDNIVTTPFNTHFTHIMPGDVIYITDAEKGDYEGEYITVAGVSDNLVTLQTAPAVYNNTCTISVVVNAVSDTNGDVGEIEIPYGYYAKRSSTLVKYAPSRKLYYLNNKPQKNTVYAYVNKGDILQTSNVQADSALLSMVEDIHSTIHDNVPNNAFYLDFVKEVL
jgi:hypothetical protein